jgi:hypothetical protein
MDPMYLRHMRKLQKSWEMNHALLVKALKGVAQWRKIYQNEGTEGSCRIDENIGNWKHLVMKIEGTWPHFLEKNIWEKHLRKLHHGWKISWSWPNFPKKSGTMKEYSTFHIRMWEFNEKWMKLDYIIFHCQFCLFHPLSMFSQ